MFLHPRLKFQESDNSESELDASPVQSPTVLYYDNDPELPLLSRLDHGFPVHALIESLLSSSIDEDRICAVQPVGVTRNAVFQVDLDKVPFEDLKADDLGSWAATGTKRTHFQFTNTNTIKYASGIPSGSLEYFRLSRRYYVHKTCNRFHRIISDIRGKILNISNKAHIPLTSMCLSVFGAIERIPCS